MYCVGHGFGKVTKPIEYEPTMNLPCSGEASKSVPYSLHGIIVHHGGSVHSGHYVAYVKVNLLISANVIYFREIRSH